MKWEISNLDGGNYLGPIEFMDKAGEWHVFELFETDTRLVFGSFTNSGFLESGYLIKEGYTDLAELSEDLETYYNNGPKYVSKIVVNERM